MNISIQKEDSSVSGSVSKQKGNNNNNNLGGLTKCLRSKLLMVDLAGSERVRRTVSKGMTFIIIIIIIIIIFIIYMLLYYSTFFPSYR